MNTKLLSREDALHGLWGRVLNKSTDYAGYWQYQQYYVALHGVGMEEVLDYLYTENPDFDGFLKWIEGAGIVPATQEEFDGPVLTDDDRAFWDKNGYVVIKNAVSQAQCEAARGAIWAFLKASPDERETWYDSHPGKKGMMLNFFQHPAFTANRYSGKIRKAYRELYGNDDIYLLIDKVSFNPPELNNHKFMGSPLHWDVSLHQPIPFVLQGLLYLNDVHAEEGAFHCVPGFHKEVGNWLAGLPKDVDPRKAAVAELKSVPVLGKAGDLVIWHHALPHCATPNKGATPRMVQYIAYKPIHSAEASIWI